MYICNGVCVCVYQHGKEDQHFQHGKWRLQASGVVKSLCGEWQTISPTSLHPLDDA